MRILVAFCVILIALAQAAYIRFFAYDAFVLGQDSLHIGRAIVLAFSVPFLALTVPALVFLRKGFYATALGLAAGSVLACVVLWRTM